MDIYHERLLKHSHMDLLQFNEDYTDNHMITTYPSAPHVASTFVQATRLAA